MSTLDTVESIKEEIRSVPRPDNVGEADIDLGFDSTGDRAMWIWFYVNGNDESEAFVEQLASFAQNVESRILARHGSDIWPYVRFR
jgi:hypothetical protein